MRVLVLLAAVTVAHAQTSATCLAGTDTVGGLDDTACTARGPGADDFTQGTCQGNTGDNTICTYTPADCTTVNQCTESIETAGKCGPEQDKADTTPCNDGDANTENDQCTTGTCAGTPIACDSIDFADLAQGNTKVTGCNYTCQDNYEVTGGAALGSGGSCTPEACDEKAFAEVGQDDNKTTSCTYSCKTGATEVGNINDGGSCSADACDVLANADVNPGDNKVDGCNYSCDTDYVFDSDGATCQLKCDEKTNMDVSGNQLEGCTYTCVAGRVPKNNIQTAEGTCEPACPPATDNMSVEGNVTDQSCVYTCVSGAAPVGELTSSGGTSAPTGTCAAQPCAPLDNATVDAGKNQVTGCTYTCEANFVKSTDGQSCYPECTLAAKDNTKVTGNQTEGNCAYECVENSTATGDIQADGTCDADPCDEKTNMTVSGDKLNSNCVYACVANTSETGDIQAADGTCDADVCDVRANAQATGDKLAENCAYTCDEGYVESTNGLTCELPCAGKPNMDVTGNQADGCTYSCVDGSTATGDIQADGTCGANACEDRANGSFTGDKVVGCVYTCDEGYADVSESCDAISCPENTTGKYETGDVTKDCKAKVGFSLKDIKWDTATGAFKGKAIECTKLPKNATRGEECAFTCNEGFKLSKDGDVCNDTGFPIWAIIVIVLVAVALLTGVGVFLCKSNFNKSKSSVELTNEPEMPTAGPENA